jgi:hypothetical protein
MLKLMCDILHHLALSSSFIYKSVYDFLFSVIPISYEQIFTANNFTLNL